MDLASSGLPSSGAAAKAVRQPATARLMKKRCFMWVEIQGGDTCAINTVEAARWNGMSGSRFSLINVVSCPFRRLVPSSEELQQVRSAPDDGAGYGAANREQAA